MSAWPRTDSSLASARTLYTRTAQDASIRSSAPPFQLPRETSETRGPTTRVAALSRLACLTLLLAMGCSRPGAWADEEPPPLPVASGALRLVQEPEAGFSPLYELIDGARENVSMEMYMLSDDAMVEKLVQAHERGVRVAVLLDTAYGGQRINKAAFARLEAAGADVRWAPKGRIYHIKAYTVDPGTERAVAAVGSGNLTKSAKNERDAWIITTDPAQVGAVQATFDSDFAQNPRLGEAKAAPGLLWSPGAADAFAKAIRAAKNTVDFTSEVLSDPRVVDSLAAAAKRGVRCRVVMNDDPKWSRAFHQISTHGCQVRVVPAKGKIPYQHEKLVLTDSEMILGSQNASRTSLNRNRELSVRLPRSSAPEIVNAAERAFEKDYQAAAPL